MSENFLFNMSDYEEKQQYKKITDISDKYKESYKIIASCKNERELEEVYNALIKMGIKCKPLIS